jgi:predicted 3-demethylubiquinone-9 3-methyltransferase (glyoxalase superfamily)
VTVVLHEGTIMRDLSIWLWFNNDAEDAAKFYTNLFGGSIGAVERFPEGGPMKAGEVMTVSFTILGHEFNALNGGEDVGHTHATSFMVPCDNQDELDRIWDALSEGGKPMPCGWVSDRYGVSWQVVPSRLKELLDSSDAASAQRVWQSLMQMGKIDIKTLEDAARG